MLGVCVLTLFNTLRPRHNGCHFADDIFKCIFLNENVWIPIKISLKFVPKGPINYIPALVHIMAWRRPGDKSLSETMMVRLLTHICATRPQWVQESIFHICINENGCFVNCLYETVWTTHLNAWTHDAHDKIFRKILVWCQIGPGHLPL